ncbi:hypothetical protein KIN20_036740 [Parelaphostrongylus tenuis]|uniref:Uncharacterized protein n=1 Tax=Parelaphostrongylus tenuis TaxID=148309 RepID=A0AAD5RDG1_PARTN|nr:hypothetical protein KIN20_036740 [Parelaphostrongylus tenuis]
MKEEDFPEGFRVIRLTTSARTVKSLQPQDRQYRFQLLKMGSSKVCSAITIGRSNIATYVTVSAGICATAKPPLVFINGNVEINAARYQQQDLQSALESQSAQQFVADGITL